MSDSDSKTTKTTGADADYSATSGVAPDLLEILVCPLGKAPLELRDGVLVCTRCGPSFKIEDGIPIMLIEEAALPEGVERIEDLECQRGEA